MTKFHAEKCCRLMSEVPIQQPLHL